MEKALILGSHARREACISNPSVFTTEHTPCNGKAAATFHSVEVATIQPMDLYLYMPIGDGDRETTQASFPSQLTHTGSQPFMCMGGSAEPDMPPSFQLAMLILPSQLLTVERQLRYNNCCTDTGSEAVLR